MVVFRGVLVEVALRRLEELLVEVDADPLALEDGAGVESRCRPLEGVQNSLALLAVDRNLLFSEGARKGSAVHPLLL